MAEWDRSWWYCLNNERGAALFAAVLAALLLSVALASFITLSRSEGLIAMNDRDEAQALFAADAGANHGRWMLAQRLRVDLPLRVAAIQKPAMAANLIGTYDSPGGAARFLVDLAQAEGGPNFVICPAGACPEPSFTPEIPDDQQALLTLASTTPSYNARVIVSAVAPPVIGNGGQSALLTYTWRIESIGTSGRATQAVIHDSASAGLPTGQFNIALQATFAQYAHFINRMGPSDPWISFRHTYTGPVHTNTRFNILGNPGGPTFRSEVTQTLSATRFYNGGSAITTASDSSPNDWPLLGPAPGALCKVVDCAGFTRSFDFDPITPGIQSVPLPQTGGPELTAMINAAKGRTPAGCIGPPFNCGVPVVVANEVAPGVSGGVTSLAGTVNGGIFVEGDVVDLQLGAVATGQKIILQTPAVGTPAIPRRTVIIENRGLGTVTVLRQCLGPAPPGVGCAAGGANWNPDTTLPPPIQTVQTLTGLLSPDLRTDNGVIFVNNGSVGSAGTSHGLRRDSETAGVTAAVDQNTRITIGASKEIVITGELNYQIDPRGADGVFSTPTPGTGDDNLAVQNVLGIISWNGGVHLSSGLNGDLSLHAMIMAPNLTVGAAPAGQVLFDDCGGAFRGAVNLLGGVVEMTMGCFGQAGNPGSGYGRNWVFDERFRRKGLTPPSFPGFPNFMTSVGLGIDSYGWRAGRF